MATIYCFSSTGNSLYTAKRIAEKIDGEVKSMTDFKALSCNDDVIGFVYPTYFWGLPITAERFIKRLDVKNPNAYIFAVTTFGGASTGVNGRIAKLLSQKERKLSYNAKIKAVENYNVLLKVNDSEAFHRSFDERLKPILNDISQRKYNKVVPYTFINSITYAVFPAHSKKCALKFTVSDDCTGCGICEKVCPSHNIKLTDGKPVFSNGCEHCLGCIHACPKKAVNWTGKTIGKPRYLNPHITLDELMKLNSGKNTR